MRILWIFLKILFFVLSGDFFSNSKYLPKHFQENKNVLELE